MTNKSVLSFYAKGTVTHNGKYFFATCPTLGLATCALTRKDADKKMCTAISLWADYLYSKDALIKRLKTWSIDYKMR